MEFDIVRAWKDARYRLSLTSEQRATLPENPAGTCELTDADLESAQGSLGGGPVGSNSLDNCIISLGATIANSPPTAAANANGSAGNFICNTFAAINGKCGSNA